MEVIKYKLLFSEQSLEDVDFFKKSGNVSLQTKISKLLIELQTHPETGTGQPEKLKYVLSGCMSRRINREHRLLYMVNNNTKEVKILSLRYHY